MDGWRGPSTYTACLTPADSAEPPPTINLYREREKNKTGNPACCSVDDLGGGGGEEGSRWRGYIYNYG